MFNFLTCDNKLKFSFVENCQKCKRHSDLHRLKRTRVKVKCSQCHQHSFSPASSHIVAEKSLLDDSRSSSLNEVACDTRLLGRPQVFASAETEWQHRRFSFRAYTWAIDGALSELLATAADFDHWKHGRSAEHCQTAVQLLWESFDKRSKREPQTDWNLGSCWFLVASRMPRHVW